MSAAQSTVSVPTWVAVSAVTALVMSCSTAAYLLGRSHPHDAAQPAAADVSRHSPAAAASTPAAPVIPSPSVAHSSATNTAGLGSYLDALEATARTKNSNRTVDSVAQSVVGAVLSGSSDPFDDLLGEVRRAQSELSALHPPQEALHIHTEAASILEGTARLYEALQLNVSHGQLDSIGPLQADATALSQRAQTLSAQIQELRSTLTAP